MKAPADAMDPEETLARWRAEEAAVRARLQRAPGVASPAQVAGRSGLQIFQALLAGEIPPPPMAATLDFTPLRIEPGFAEVQGQPGFSHYNPMGTVHGGWFANMLDTAMGCAVHHGQRSPHLFNQTPQQHEHIIVGMANDLEPIAGGIPVPEFEGIQRNNIPEQARLEMELVPFAGAIHHPDRLETHVREALMTGMPRRLRFEASAAKLSISLPRRTVADDVIVGRALATPLALHLSHAAHPFCHGWSSIAAESRFGMSVTINAVSPLRARL